MCRPQQRLRAALAPVKRLIRELALDSDFWSDTVWSDTVWSADSTPVPCGMSRPTVQRPDPAGSSGPTRRAEPASRRVGYGYRASHSRYFWGLRLYPVSTPTGTPIPWALANPTLDEREILAAMLEVDAELVARREGTLLITGKGFASKAFEWEPAKSGIALLRPSFKHDKQRFGESMLTKVRQLIKSVNDTLKEQLDLKQHGGRSFEGIAIRVAQRLLAMAAGIWHNNQLGAPVTRSLIAFDH